MLSLRSYRSASAMFLLAFFAVVFATQHRMAFAQSAPQTAPATAEMPKADDNEDDDDEADDKASPETPKTADEKMRARLPQPIIVGQLIGQPLLDGGHSTIGYVDQVVRSADGKIKLIVPYRPWLGWAKFLEGYQTRLVAVPIEAVGSMGLALSSIDMDWGDYDKAPTWQAGSDKPIATSDVIQIAIARE